MFGWRREALAGLLTLPAGTPVAGPPVSAFVPIFAEPAVSPAVPAPAPAPEVASGPVIEVEVEVAVAVVRVRASMDAALLTLVLRAVRASAGGA